MSRIVAVTGIGGAVYAAIERDDGVRVLASDYVPRDVDEMPIPGTNMVIVRRAKLDEMCVRDGLPRIWREQWAR